MCAFLLKASCTDYCKCINLDKANKPCDPNSPQILQNPSPGFAGLWWIRYSTCIAQRIERAAMCTKSIKLYRLLMDSGLCIAKPWMLCICHCTNSIKVQQHKYCRNFAGFNIRFLHASNLFPHYLALLRVVKMIVKPVKNAPVSVHIWVNSQKQTVDWFWPL